MAVLLPSVVQPPSINLAMVREDSLLPQPEWYEFFLSLVTAPTPIQELVVTTSPFSFVASVPGNVLIRGAVDSLALVRARITIDPLGPVEGFVPVSRGDELVTTYTLLPEMWFIPW